MSRTCYTLTINPDGSAERGQHTTDGGDFDLKTMQGLVGGYIEGVPCDTGRDGLTIFADEDGIAKHLPVNYLGTLVARALNDEYGTPIKLRLVGPVVACSTSKEDIDFFADKVAIAQMYLVAR